jgi:hypothetical protein
MRDISNETGHSSLQQLTFKHAFEHALAQCRESVPPAELCHLMNASVDVHSDDICHQ